MNYAIATILGSYIDNLNFVERLASVVRPMTFFTGSEQNTIKKVYPIDCSASHKDCVTGKYTDLVPNSRYKSIHYFEDGGVAPVNTTQRDWRFRSSLRLVGWINLKKLGKTDCSVSAQAVLQLINALPSGRFNSGEYKNIQITSIAEAPKSSAIFSKYTYDEAVTQYLMFPFDYYALDLTVEFTISKSCINDFDLGTPTECDTK